jgi:TrmH family RNA methyltransferase
MPPCPPKISPVEVIASRKNPLVAQMRRAASGDDPDRMLLDGVHLLDEARAAQTVIQTVAVSPRALATNDGLARRLVTSLAGVGVRIVQCADPIIEAMSPATSPTGIVAIAARPRHVLEELVASDARRPLLIVAVDVQDPGNVGAIARVAEAAGVTGFLVAGDSADPFGWKALRGAMGSAFRLPIVRERDTGAALDRLTQSGVRLAAAAAAGAERYDRVDWTEPLAILVGNEGAGLPANVLARANVRVAIPMQPPVESLNVAVSAALLAYEARRQRSLARLP